MEYGNWIKIDTSIQFNLSSFYHYLFYRVLDKLSKYTSNYNTLINILFEIYISIISRVPRVMGKADRLLITFPKLPIKTVPPAFAYPENIHLLN